MRRFNDNDISFHGVTSGGTSTCDVHTPELSMLVGIDLIYKSDIAAVVARRTKAQMLAELVSVDIIANTKGFRFLPIGEIFEDQERNGETVEDGVIHLDFSDMTLQSAIGQDATGFVLGSAIEGFSDTVRLKVKHGASTTPELVARPKYVPIDQAHLARIHKYRRQHKVVKFPDGTQVAQSEQMIKVARRDTFAVSSIGKKRYTLNTEGREIAAIHARSADIDRIDVFRGNEQLFGGEVVDFENELKKAGLAVVAGVVSILPMAYSGGRFADALKYESKPIHLDFTMNAANDFDIRTDEIGDVYR